MNDIDLKPADAMAADVAKVAASHTSFAGRIRNYFLTGLVVAGPLAITVWLIWSIVTWVDDIVRPLIPPAYRPESYMPWKIPGTGLIIAFVVLTLLGFLTANLVGRSLVELGENLLDPVASCRPDLQDDEADLRVLVFQVGLELPQGWLGRISVTRDVVTGVSVTGAGRRSRQQIAARGARLGVHALHAQPDDRIFLLCETRGHYRSRHL